MFRKSIFYILILLLVVLVIYLANQPGGRLVPLALCVLLLAVIGAYYGFYRKESALTAFGYYRLQTGAIVFFLLAVTLAYWARQERGALDQIAAWIRPYPEVSQVIGAPKITEDYLWSWIIETEDSVDKVIAFYLDPANLDGWTVRKSGQVFIFEKEKFKLVIMISQHVDGSRLLYALSSLPAR